MDTDDSAPEFLSLTYKDEAGSEATFTFAEGRAFGNANLMNGSDFVLEDCNNYLPRLPRVEGGGSGGLW